SSTVCHTQGSVNQFDYVVGTYNNELVITSEQPVPLSFRNGDITIRIDPHDTLDETDMIIVNRLAELTIRGISDTLIVCADTDPFVLIMRFHNRCTQECGGTTEGQFTGQCLMDTTVLAHNHRRITDYLPEACGLSNYDTTSKFYITGKAVAFKALSTVAKLWLEIKASQWEMLFSKFFHLYPCTMVESKIEECQKFVMLSGQQKP
ncbi:hypothetical protein SK128_023380, partial [Halocaridina rubra]